MSDQLSCPRYSPETAHFGVISQTLGGHPKLVIQHGRRPWIVGLDMLIYSDAIGQRRCSPYQLHASLDRRLETARRSAK